MRCEECETFLDIEFDEVSVYFWLPLAHTHAKVAAFLGSTNFAYTLLEGDVIRVDVTDHELRGFLIQLKGTLTSQELSGSKAMSLPRDSAPDFRNLHRVVTLDKLISLSHGDWVRRMVEEGRYTTHFQPLVSAKTGEIRAYEALFRGREVDGSRLSPGHIFSTAAGAGMMFQVDLAARRSAVELASKLGIGDKKLFINFCPTAIYDPSYCLRTTVSACEELGLDPSQIVFEVTESEEVTDLKHLKGILTFYRNAGFKVALDDVGAGYSGLNLLMDLEPDLMKIDRHLITNIDQKPFKQSIVTHLIQMAKEHGIKTVVEGIETADEAAWLREAGADLIQGYYFARPSAELHKEDYLKGLPQAA